MSLIRCLPASIFFAATVIACVGEATAQYASLVARVPRGANAIVILDVQRLLTSPLAQQQNWREKQERAAEAGITMVAPTAQQFLMASHLDYEFMQPVWEVAMANLSYEPSLPRLAATWAGEIDRISNRNAVRLANDSYVVQFGPNLAGVYRPANRQSVAGWLTSTDTAGNRLSPYLQKALGYSENAGTPIIMALDLTDVVSETTLRKQKDQFESLKNREVDYDRLISALASLQGVTLGVTVSDHISGALRIDFADDVSFLDEALAKALILEVLDQHSAMIDEMAEWRVKIVGNRVQIGGPLYRSGMQRVLSVLDVPAALQTKFAENATSSTSPASSDEALMQTSSQQYFKSVSGLIDDLRGQQGQFKSINSVGTWLSRYAEKIDKLPILHVDPQLLDYGRYVSSSFRVAAEAIRSAGGNARVRQLNTPNQFNYYGRWGTNGGYGGYVQDVKATQQDRTRIRTEERVSSATDVRQVMQDVMNATAEIRQVMTQKYEANF